MNTSQDNKVLGIFHTHPYDQSEGGYTGVSLSGGDAAYLINNKQNMIIAQSGTEQFLYLRTAETPSFVDPAALNNAQNDRISQLVTNGGNFSQASKTAAIETAKANGLAYYEGAGRLLTRVYP